MHLIILNSISALLLIVAIFDTGNLSSVPHPGGQPPSTVTSSLSEPFIVRSFEMQEPLQATGTADAMKRTFDGYAADGNKIIAADGSREDLQIYRPLMLPNDPRANQNWVTSSRVDAAWDIPGGSQETLLAIVDTGFALQHEEFEGRWHTNTGESGPAVSEALSRLNCTDRSLPLNTNCNLIDDDFNGIVDDELGPTTVQNPSRLNCSDQKVALDKSCNLLDDDGNGMIDDYRGWDFMNFDNSVQAGEINPAGDGVHHGTYVAGVAAATGNNGKGIAGVDWNTKILPLQGLSDEGPGNTLAVGRAIRYAADQGAHVISLSLGSVSGDNFVRQAVQYAIGKGSLVVAASGNDGCNCMSFPANYPEVIAVGAADSTGAPASFSSYGANLDLLAPGINLHTTDWTSLNGTSAYASNISGTSLATPIVSGLLTRLLSQRPASSQLQLTAALHETLNKTNVTNHRSDLRGFGFLDAGRTTMRLNVAENPLQRNHLTAISLGDRLPGFSASEKVKPASVYQCDNSSLAATAIRKLSKNGTDIFSVSQVEVERARINGWGVSFFAYGCVAQVHDAPAQHRSLNVYREFLNRESKL